MAASTTAAASALKNTLSGMFAVERNSVALGRGLVEVMVNYLVETLLVREASEVDINDARTIAEDAWADLGESEGMRRHEP